MNRISCTKPSELKRGSSGAECLLIFVRKLCLLLLIMLCVLDSYLRKMLHLDVQEKKDDGSEASKALKQFRKALDDSQNDIRRRMDNAVHIAVH